MSSVRDEDSNCISLMEEKHIATTPEAESERNRMKHDIGAEGGS